MSKVEFGQTLDGTGPVEANLDAMFADLALPVNTPLLGPENIRPNAVVYRHLKGQHIIMTSASFSSNAPTFGVISGGYYPMTDGVLIYNLPDTGYDNSFEADMPVFNIYAFVHHNDTASGASGTNLITRYCLGVSTDGGATWTPMDTQTSRSADSGNGSAPAFFDGTSPHYITGAAGYQPRPNRDRGVMLIGSFGGHSSRRTGPSNGARRYCVMSNHNTNGKSNIKVQLFGSARWKEL